MKPQIYLIHTSDDNGVASVVQQALDERKMDCRQQSGDVPGAEGVAAKVIDDSDVVVLILSSAVNGSALIKREVECAVKADKEIIPFRIDSTPLPKYLEFYLSTTHWLDATTSPPEKHMTQLVYTVRHLLGLERERAAKKAVAAMILGALSIFVGSILLGPLAIVLGKVELKAIASKRSSMAGRRYARAGVISGAIGTVVGIALIFLAWYLELNLN